MSVTARLAVIGLVTLLAAGIGLAAGSFLLSARVALGAGADYVPADAPFYLELRLEPSEAQDAALRDLLGRFPAIEGVDLDAPLAPQLTERLDELLAETGADVSWTADVAPWFDGHVAMAVTDLPASAMSFDPTVVPESPPLIVLLGTTDATAATDAIGRLLAEAGEEAPTFSTSEHGGVTISVAEDDAREAPHGAYAVTDDQVVIGSDADAVRAALDAGASGSATLAEMAEVQRLTDRLPTDWLAFMAFDLTEAMAQALDDAGDEEPAVGEAFATLFENQPLRGAMAISAEGQRIVLDSATDAPTGPFAVENADRGLAARVPADALYFAEAGNLGPAFAAVIEPMKEAIGAAPDGEEQLRTLEAALGTDVEDFVSWIGDGAMTIGWDGEQPYAGLALVPTDVEAAERRLGQLASFASLGAMDPSSGLSVDDEDVDGATITTIRWQDPNAGASMGPALTGVIIEYVVTGDVVLVGFGDRFVRRALALDEADSLAAQARFGDAVTELGGLDNAGVVWIDLSGTRQAIEHALEPMIGLADPESIYEDEVRPWLLPLDRFVGVNRLEGDVLLQRAALLVE